MWVGQVRFLGLGKYNFFFSSNKIWVGAGTIRVGPGRTWIGAGRIWVWAGRNLGKVDFEVRQKLPA